MESVLEIKDLSKNYGEIKALNKLNVEVKKGMVFGILGPNGSGKTTTLGILLGVLNQTSGSFSWFGNGDAVANRRRIGALLETPNFFPYLTAVQNLRIVGQIKEVEDVEPKIDRVLKAVNLHERRNSKFKTFSLGMKQRLAIASALLSDPEVLVLDEPTNGLDPQGIAEIRSLVKEIAADGKTILIASHQLDEIEKVCTDVVILKKGVVIAQSDVESILHSAKQIVIKSDKVEACKEIINNKEGIDLVSVNDGEMILSVAENISTADVNQLFFEKGVVLSELRIMKKSLEAQFLEITKE
ncbi:ABC transporter ATP-binding protein [Paracrocinitomix mangrovi]|uniref:ABC transporter ATP-binding protein n=1 Tax=Paracrocinitomix mangrovi TaxID=2862509 RepID=UPI001C8D33C1|nr:ABC transporter ATP-binding protein [Paracrocinitomix mangrovi]UKN03651.1 ABC transporter ATP-binding protein [Paracrocinitomix mangrovi]